MRLYVMALHLVGQVVERPGDRQHPFVQWGHEICGLGEGVADEVPWCSSGLNVLALLGGYQRSRSAAARSWLRVGLARDGGLERALPGDIVVLRRGAGAGQAGPTVLQAPGHVGVFEHYDASTGRVTLLSGNVRNAWIRATFPAADVLDVRVPTPVTT